MQKCKETGYMYFGNRGAEGGPFGVIIFPLCLAVLVQVMIFAVNGIPPDGGFFGPDSFTRMARVRELLSHGWFGPQLPRLAPDGLDHHWTRPLDGLIAALRWLLLPLLDGDRALYWAGVLVSPLLQVAAVGSTMVILRRHLSEDSLHILALVVVLAAPLAANWFAPARADHHSLQIALMLILMATVFVCTRIDASLWHCGSAGVLSVLLAWAAPGGILPAAAVLASFGPLWLVYGAPLAMRGGVAACVAVLVMIPALWLERGTLVPVFAFDRLSGIHLGFFVALAIGFGGARACERIARTWQERAVVAGLAVAVGIGGLLVTMPGILTGASLAETDRFYDQIRGGLIDESRRLFDLARDRHTSVLATLREGILYGGLFLAGVFACLWAARHRTKHPMLLVVATVLAAYAVYYQNSFGGLVLKNMGYLSAVVAIPYAAVLGDAATKLRQQRGPWIGTLSAVAVKLGAASWMFLAAFIPATPGVGSDSHTQECNVGGVQGALARLAASGRRHARVLAVPEVSAELLYHTDFRVLGIPTHREQPLFEEMYRTLAGSPDTAADRMRDLDIAGLVACSPYNVYFERQGVRGETLHGVAARGGDIPGLRRLTPNTAGVQVYALTRE